MAVLTVVLAGCSGRESLPPPATAGAVESPSQDPGLPVRSTSGPGTTYLPWSLTRIDQANDRVYLTAEKVRCSTPVAAQVTETAGAVTIRVLGTPPSEPCTQQAVVAVTYVQLPTPLNGRQVLGARS